MNEKCGNCLHSVYEDRTDSLVCEVLNIYVEVNDNNCCAHYIEDVEIIHESN